jgi:hypothetical protein
LEYRIFLEADGHLAGQESPCLKFITSETRIRSNLYHLISTNVTLTLNDKIKLVIFLIPRIGEGIAVAYPKSVRDEVWLIHNHAL